MSDLNANILFFLSAIGAFNGLLLAGYLFVQRKFGISYLFLSALLFAISIRVGKSVLFFFAPDLSKLVLQIGLSACFFIGPLLFFYSAAVVNKLSSLSIKWQYHLSALALLCIVVGLAYPYQSNPELWQSYSITIIYRIWLVYLIAALFLTITSVKSVLSTRNTLQQHEFLLINVNIGVTIIWVAYAFSSYTSYIVGALSFSFCLYLSLLLVVWRIKTKQAPKYVDKKIEETLASNIHNELCYWMEKEKLYRDANLTLSKLANKLTISPAQLSQYLNDNVNKSFANFVNEYRINQAREILLSDTRITMENVAEICGYNSTSTFYNAFKKFEGMPPAKYREIKLSAS